MQVVELLNLLGAPVLAGAVSLIILGWIGYRAMDSTVEHRVSEAKQELVAQLSKSHESQLALIREQFSHRITHLEHKVETLESDLTEHQVKNRNLRVLVREVYDDLSTVPGVEPQRKKLRAIEEALV